jgi:hypothetical protein
VVDVANGSDVDVWFGPVKFLFRHDSSLDRLYVLTIRPRAGVFG